jgi:hypothetical protein
LTGSPAISWISDSTLAAVWAKSADSFDSTWRSIEMPRRSIRASTEINGRSSVSYTAIMRSAARRGFSTVHSLKITSASSAE